MTVSLAENQHAKQAKILMVGYIHMVMRKCELRYDSDNRMELEAIVDEILAATADGIAAAADYHYQQAHGEKSVIAMLQTEYYKEKR